MLALGFSPASAEVRAVYNPGFSRGMSTPPKMAPDTRKTITEALIHFAKTVTEEQVVGGTKFTPDPEANDLILSDPFAFLLAVIFDQGINAERAWAAPLQLKRALGGLKPDIIAKNEELVRKAIQGPPSLHRFKNKLARWVVSAADRVVKDYAGSVQKMWSDEPTAQELQGRFRQFEGIGQKKAAMAVEILNRDFRVRVNALSGSDIAYDVHVRRVFLRTGLTTRDEINEMIAVARELHPERPGELDWPAWYIGRQWCHPTTPDCRHCVLNALCPKQIHMAAGVKGV